MQQRLGVEHLNQPITSQLVETAIMNTERTINELSELSPTWLSFCNEKLQLASESLGFLLKQRVRFYEKGYPSRDLDYLKLIDHQIEELKQVYLSFYRFAPGVVHRLKYEEREIYAWLMLQPELGHDLDNLMCGLNILNDLEPAVAKVFAVQSQIENFDSVLAELIEGQSKNSSFYLDCLRLRQTLSIGLIKRWVNAGSIPPQAAFPILAVQDVAEGVEWINENAREDQYLFECLITKSDRGTWFRQQFGIETGSVLSTQAVTYAKLLELKECMAFDIDAPMAPCTLC